MSTPQVWLRSAIEDAASCDAYPIQAPEGLAPPYVIYSRTGTAREQILSDTLDNPAGGTETPPTASIQLEVYVDDYVQAWDKADAIVGAIHGFAGELEEAGQIESCLVTDQKDSDPVYLDGRDQPTYVIEMTVEIRWAS